jgi:hypothetical protein
MNLPEKGSCYKGKKVTLTRDKVCEEYFNGFLVAKEKRET